MATEPRPGRVILHLHHGATERAIIRAAAELAQMLGVALQGVFLEDEALPELAALPFIREFRLGTGAWQKLDRQQIAEEQRAAAAEARRLLDEAAAALGVTRLFEIISGDPALFVAATSQAGDIIVVAQPRLPAERLVHATARWLEAAHGCAASVLLVPRMLARRAGPVAAVVCAESDPALGDRGAHCRRGGRGAAAAGLGDGGAGEGCGRAGALRRSAPMADFQRPHTRRSAGGCPGRSRLCPTSVWSCWGAVHAGRTTRRYRRISRPREAFRCWWWNPDDAASGARRPNTNTTCKVIVRCRCEVPVANPQGNRGCFMSLRGAKRRGNLHRSA